MAAPLTRAASGSDGARPLRAVYCTRGGWFGELALERLRGCGQLQLCGIVRSTRTFDPSFGFLQGALAYLRRCGAAYSWYLLCATTLAEALRAVGRRSRSGNAAAGPATRAERPQGTGRPGEPGGQPLAVPICSTRDINSPAALRFLADCAPDVLISAFFDQRLHAPALAVPTLGCLNIHPSLLPSFAGVDPVLQAQLHGEAALGVTVHYMTVELDAGNILAQRVVPVPARASVFQATAALFAAGAELLVEELARVERGDAGRPQGAGGSYQSWPNRAEIRALHRAGGRLLRLEDWAGVWRHPVASSPLTQNRQPRP